MMRSPAYGTLIGHSRLSGRVRLSISIRCWLWILSVQPTLNFSAIVGTPRCVLKHNVVRPAPDTANFSQRTI